MSVIRDHYHRVGIYIRSIRWGESFFGRVAVLASGAGVGYLVAVLVSPVVSRLYTPIDFGILGIFTSVFSVLGIITDLRYGMAIPLPESNRDAILLIGVGSGAILIVCLITFLVVMVMGSQILSWIYAAKLKPYFLLLPVALLTSGVQQLFGYWALRRGKYKVIGQSKIAQSMGWSIATVSMGLSVANAYGLILGEIFGRLIASGRLLLFAKRDSCCVRTGIRIEELWNIAFRYFRFPLISGPAAILHSIQTSLPVLLFAILFGTHVAGWFTFVQRVIWAPLSLIAETVAQVYYGEASVLARRDSKQLAKLFYTVEVTLLKLVLLPVLFLAATAPQLFVIVFGQEWYEAGKYMQYLGLTFVVMLVVGPVLHTLNILERQLWLFVSDAMGSAFVVAGIFASYYLGWPPMGAVMIYGATMILIYSVLFVLVRIAIQVRVSEAG